MSKNKKIWAIIGASAVVLAGAAVVIAAEVRKFRKSIKVVAEAIEIDDEDFYDCDCDDDCDCDCECDTTK